MEGTSRLVRAKFAFKATNNDELSFSKGDTITLTQAIDGGWWEGTLSGKTGWFPSNYVIELKTDDVVSLSPTAAAVTAFTDISVKEQHHLLVAEHLLDSEREYAAGLEELLNQYLKPLSTSSLLTGREYTILSGNISDIVTFQLRLLHLLTECRSLPIPQQKVGGIFLTSAPQLQELYHSYSSNHPSSVALLAQHREELSTFMESQGCTTSGSQALTGFLSAPFRRLDKYPVLLKELERYIDDAHPDRGDTQRAIAVYKGIQSSCLDIRKDKEMELEVLSANISNWEGEDLPSLGDVQLSAHVKIHSDDKLSSDRIMLMFPSCILMISVSQRMSYHYQGKLLLGGLKVTKLEDTDIYTNALQISGTMIEEMVISFNSTSKRQAWFDYISNLSADTSQEVVTAGKPKMVEPSTMPAQVTSKAKVLSISNSAKTAQVIDSYDRLGLGSVKMWTMSCLRPLPPSRPQFAARDDTRSPKMQRKASTLGRRKNNVDDAKILQEDAKILKVIESYCTSARTRRTVNSSILDSPNVLIAEDEKIICEVTKDNETIIEERSLVDTVYVIKDQIKDLQSGHERLRKELEDERKARKKLESIVHKSMQTSSLIPLATLNHNNHNNDPSQ
ncbi:rho guanine nucleotide exchange factor 7-like [Watersipora subatra]|uniref:rho guanine nucleotide exchange factor 7-like n=1 Tax=Watersipora subatra TaxID=2589382 RepID=UPI00355BC76E